MPRPDPKAPREGQAAMFDLPAPASAMPRGERSRQIEEAINEARRLDGENAIYGALDAAILHCGRVLDSFEHTNRPYGMAKLAAPMLELLAARHMTPESRRELDAAQNDKLTELLNDLATPEIRDPA